MMVGNSTSPEQNRLSTGIAGLDSVIKGYPAGQAVLLHGGPGTGKTIMTLHFINAACSAGKEVMHILTEEEKSDVFAQSQSFGWNLKAFEEAGIYHPVEILEDRAAGATMPSFHVFMSRMQAKPGTAIVLDNIGVFDSIDDVVDVRNAMDRMVHALRKNRNTTVIIADEAADDNILKVASHSVNGVISLLKRNNPFTDRRERMMEIVKMRNTPVPASYLRYDITSTGINILPDQA